MNSSLTLSIVSRFCVNSLEKRNNVCERFQEMCQSKCGKL